MIGKSEHVQTVFIPRTNKNKWPQAGANPGRRSRDQTLNVVL